MPAVISVEQAVERARHLAAQADRTGERAMLGLVGAPGVGKSTLASALVQSMADRTENGADPAAGAGTGLFTMDGFHLAHQVLTLRGDVTRKGAPETFDGAGYVNLLRRLRARDEEIVWAPDYQRDLHNGIAGAVALPASLPFLITEGNYLLLDHAPWNAVPTLLDEVWFVEGSEQVRIERLAERHVRHGRSAEAAMERATCGVDAENARLVQGTRDRADVIVDVTAWEV